MPERSEHTMKLVLQLIAAAIFAAMTFVTIRASLRMSLWAAWAPYAANPWAVATLWDAYCGFTLFWLWVAYKERSWPMRILWLFLIYGLGNIATSLYVFLALSRLGPQDPPHAALIRRNV